MVYCVVKTLTGRSFMVDLGNTEEMQRVTVGQLKTKIFQTEGNPEDQQRLLFGGKELEDTNRLCKYGIQHESIIMLVLKLRGGGLPQTDSDDELSDKEGETRRSREKLADFRCCLL